MKNTVHEFQTLKQLIMALKGVKGPQL